ncbi:MAG TPA: hypothetical protein VMJ64_18925 [Anaerolineales bacterium]|nr:hypothetical protein [Anaerolineales bacterium]
MSSDIKTFARTYIAIGAAISLLAILQTQAQTEALFKFRTRYKWVLLMGVFAFYVAVGVYFVLRRSGTGALWQKLHLEVPSGKWAHAIGTLLIALPFPIIWLAHADFYGRGLDAFFRLMWLFWGLALVQTVGWKMAARVSWPLALAFAVLLDGLVIQVYSVSLAVTDYPFSAGWSEASRFYYGSLPFSQSIYGVKLPLSVWHGTRYFLQSIPFIVHGLPLWFHRLWQVLLWIDITALTGWLLVRRLQLQDRVLALILAAWFFLYVFQGAVYYHLQVCVIIILLGVSPRHPWRSLAAVLVASFWAGMSRLNWYPVPAMLAIAIYLLEEPYRRAGNMLRYLAKPFIWGVMGLGTALLGQAFYIAISGNTNLEAFGSSLTSALLWYRWFPSATNPIGIIPGILIVSLPLGILLFYMIRGHVRNLHPVRWLLLLAMLLMLLAGGLVVSTKIGGGGDLHNMDAYMVLLALIGAYFIGQRVEAEPGAPSAFAPPVWPGIALLLLIPVAFTLTRITSPFTYDRARAEQDLASLRQTVQGYGAAGPVLFINERQLLTFGLIPNVPIVPEDEVVSLMEMAISGNRPYLAKFYQDLATHRFAAIVTHKQNLGVEEGDFIEENNAWAAFVAQPLLCQYKPVLTLEYSDIQVLVPRANPCPIPPPSLDGP